MIQLQIETTNVCDAACVFCPHSRMQRSVGTMALALSRKIIEDAATIPLIDHLSFVGLGEPLLDRFLVQRIAHARAAMPGIWIDLTTDGSYLRPKMTDALIAAGLSHLNVSLNATNRDSRKAIMGIDNFDAVVEYIEYARAAGAGQMSVTVKGIQEKDLMEGGEPEAFLLRWGADAFLHQEGNWAGTMRPVRVVPKAPCVRALRQIMVLWDGRVSLCCFDAEGAVILGDLNTQRLRDVYAGELALSIRQAHHEGRRGSLPLCGTCTAI